MIPHHVHTTSPFYYIHGEGMLQHAAPCGDTSRLRESGAPPGGSHTGYAVHESVLRGVQSLLAVAVAVGARGVHLLALGRPRIAWPTSAQVPGILLVCASPAADGMCRARWLHRHAVALHCARSGSQRCRAHAAHLAKRPRETKR